MDDWVGDNENGFELRQPRKEKREPQGRVEQEVPVDFEGCRYCIYGAYPISVLGCGLHLIGIRHEKKMS